ncbi:MAG: type II CAAX endopeptidase family protein [Bacillota bacterium]|nr:type II CAAX endopeptidase family protein [Bacillota bacterium]
MKAIFRANLFILLLVVFQIISQITIVGRLEELIGYSNLLMIDEYLFLLIPVILYMIITKQSPKEVFRLNRIYLADVFNVIIIAVLCQPIASFLSLLTSLFFTNPVSEALNDLQSVSLPVMLFMIAVTPAICEEAVTRGVVLHGYNKVGLFKAALINGLVFCILHLSPQQSLYTFALGFIFAYMVRVTNSIFTSMLCHFTFNGIQVSLSKLVADNAGTNSAQGSTAAVVTLAQIMKEIIIRFAFAAVCGIIIYSLIKLLESRHKASLQESMEPLNDFHGDTLPITNVIQSSDDMAGELNRADAGTYLYNGSAVRNRSEALHAYVPLILLVILYPIVIVLFRLY